MQPAFIIRWLVLTFLCNNFFCLIVSPFFPVFIPVYMCMYTYKQQASILLNKAGSSSLQPDGPFIPELIPPAFFFSCPIQALFLGLAPVPGYHPAQSCCNAPLCLPKHHIRFITPAYVWHASPAVHTHPVIGQLLSLGIYSRGVPKATAL